ncbi:hypothetical protein FOMPIDRAFT_1044763 [Fomitopsis schrenkii]|uniref:Uncharacterized protein n=1 Tax=Fomitopsis schrenkii TaxID=2126942 RepID=S8EMN8_FOMSC|nr:hypothetical protein FOMPIDRAFT_1044763 [Fomitopsis schrenkii]
MPDKIFSSQLDYTQAQAHGLNDARARQPAIGEAGIPAIDEAGMPTAPGFGVTFAEPDPQHGKLAYDAYNQHSFSVSESESDYDDAYTVGDIKTVYHPRIHKAPLIQSWDEYLAQDEQLRAPPPPKEKPWKPYQTQANFESSEIVSAALLPAEQIDNLITLIRKVASGADYFTITKNADLVSHTNMQLVLETAATRNKKDAEKLLKEYGLHPLQNTFYKLKYTDPHKALNFDKLHGNDSGLFGDHIWSETVRVVKDKGHVGISTVDQQANDFPHWRNLVHFKQIGNINFNDGTKFSSLSKTTPYVVHNVIASKKGSEGYLLLCLLRKYLELDMLYSFVVQTDENIAAIQEKLPEFSQCFKNYQKETTLPTKNWNFPKIHYQQHVADDMEAKGVTRNYNTKPDEHMHGFLKKTYLRHTDTQISILTQEHHAAVLKLICAYINAYKEWLENPEIDEDSEDEDGEDKATPQTMGQTLRFGKHIFGAPEKSISLGELAASNPVGKAIPEDLTELLKAMRIKTDQGNNIIVKNTDEIKETHFLHASYQSETTWEQAQDLLCCSPEYRHK